MDSSSPYREGLPTTSSSSSSSKAERRWRSKSVQPSKPSIVMAFFSCLAWLYVAGRLWQDAENRTVLVNLLKKNADQKPKVLTVEDKLMVLGCKDLERRIVEAEMELTLAKSQGYLKNQLQQSGSSSGKRFLAVIGVYTGFGSRLNRNTFRGSWMPKGDALRKLEERGVVIRFVIGRSANRGDSLDRNIDGENLQTKDFLILEGHEEAQEELPKKAKFFFSTAIQTWDADFYVKVDDNIGLDLDGLIELLQSRRGQDSAYIGCMKSGSVITEEGRQWYEPEWWKFGDEKSLMKLKEHEDFNVFFHLGLLRNVYKRLEAFRKVVRLSLAAQEVWTSPYLTKNRLWLELSLQICHTLYKYFRHAAGSIFVLSKNLARYININSVSLKTYAHDDISVGSWMMGLQATYIDDTRLCCSNSRQDKVCSLA